MLFRSKLCGLSEQEATMIRNFVNRKIDSPLWYDEYRTKYRNVKLNKPYSRQSIYNQLEIVHKKILNYFRKNNLLPEGYEKPKYRRGDFR